jgi:hypothetical protein
MRCSIVDVLRTIRSPSELQNKKLSDEKWSSPYCKSLNIWDSVIRCRHKSSQESLTRIYIQYVQFFWPSVQIRSISSLDWSPSLKAVRSWYILSRYVIPSFLFCCVYAVLYDFFKILWMKEDYEEPVTMFLRSSKKADIVTWLASSKWDSLKPLLNAHECILSAHSRLLQFLLRVTACNENSETM